MPNEKNKLQTLQFWCQKTLPTVFNDSLSYYELLCKVVDALNNVIEAVNGGASVEVDIAGALEQMIEDGTLQPIIEQSVNEVVAPQIATINESIDAINESISTQGTTLNTAINTLAQAAQVAGTMKGLSNYVPATTLGNPSQNKKTWLFVGDSWSMGDSPTITQESQRLGYKFAAIMRCDYEIVGASGAGFVVTNTSGLTIPGRWAQWAATNVGTGAGQYNWSNVGGVFIIGGVNDVRNNTVGISQLSTWVNAIEGLASTIAEAFEHKVPVYVCLNMKSQTRDVWQRMYAYAIQRGARSGAGFSYIPYFTYWLYQAISANYETVTQAGSANLGGLHPTSAGYTALAQLLFSSVTGCPLASEYYVVDTSWLTAGTRASLTSSGYWYLNMATGVIRGEQVAFTTNAQIAEATVGQVLQHGGALCANSGSAMVSDSSTGQPKGFMAFSASAGYLYATGAAIAASSALIMCGGDVRFYGYIPQ